MPLGAPHAPCRQAFALVWLSLKLVGATKDVRHLSVRVAPACNAGVLDRALLSFLNLNGSQIGTFNRWTARILFGTFFFPLLSVTGLVLVLRVPNDEIHCVRIHALLVSSACCVVTGFLLSWHLLALRLWAAL